MKQKKSNVSVPQKRESTWIPDQVRNDKIRAFVAMSGGVDSSVAALLLKQRGYDVTGVFMRCWGGGSGPNAAVGASCAEQDAEDARRVAGHLSIPFCVWDFEEEYKRKVVEYMVEGYRAGQTPNPDVECNREIKFGLFLKKALAMGADFVATGHYVRLLRNPNNTKIPELHESTNKNFGSFGWDSGRSGRLFTAKDNNKDQSYFLWTLTQDQLKHCLFPIGDYLKPDVRKIAREAGLPTADKKDSQGICFLGKVTIEDFLKTYIPEKRGAVLTATGEKIGEHAGAQFYTIGQRHIGLQPIRDAKLRIHANDSNGKFASFAFDSRHSHRLYVASKDVKANTLVVAEGSDNPALYKKEVALRNVNFVTEHSNILKNVGMFVLARVRYRQPLSKAMLTSPPKIGGVRGGMYLLVFDKPQKFVAPGQSAVFYSRRGELLGGGVIV